MWIDSHCHLNHENITPLGDPESLILQARQAQVSGMLTICCRIAQEYQQLTDIAAQHDDVWCSLGTHPHEAGEEAEKSITMDQLINLAQSHRKIIALGETGLDYFYEHSNRIDQAASFRKHIRACLDMDMPIILHASDADEDMIRIMNDEDPHHHLRGVFHCFSSTAWLAEQGLARGFYFSLSGIVTFPKSIELQRIVKDIIPLNRILVETDAPFLAPTPYRGKVNQPAYVVETGAFLARLFGIPVAEMARISTDNFFTLFDRANRPC
jgi:TatD DNase family protein